MDDLVVIVVLGLGGSAGMLVWCFSWRKRRNIPVVPGAALVDELVVLLVIGAIPETVVSVC